MKPTIRNINILRAKFSGKGICGAVFVDGRYAYKIGKIYPEEVKDMRDNAKKGVGPKIYNVQYGVRIPEKMRVLLRNVGMFVAERTVMTADVLIMEIAQPVRGKMTYEEYHEPQTQEQMDKVYKIKQEYYRFLDKIQRRGGYWEDDHTGNMGRVGKFKKKPVILDI